MEIKLLFLQIQVSLAVLALLIIRLGMKKLPRVYSYLLWLLVFVRLLCPVSMETGFGFMPSASQGEAWLKENFGRAAAEIGRNTDWTTGASDAGEMLSNGGGTPGADANAAINPIEASLPAKEEENTVVREEMAAQEKVDEVRRTFVGNDSAALTVYLPDEGAASYVEPDRAWQPSDTVRIIFAALWAVGVTAILVYNSVALALVRKQIAAAELLQENIYVCSQVKTPFTLGFFQPKIYLPASLREEEQEYIICHERVHISRRDYLVKNLAFLLTAVYWFNPMVWVAFYFLERDMEMSCDETVIRKLGEEIKKPYSQSLLNFAKGKCAAAVTPITFGENSVKQRVENVLSYKNAKKWTLGLGIAVLLAAAAVLFTVREDHAEGSKDPEQENQIPESGNHQTKPQAERDLTSEQSSFQSALDCWARAFTDRDGDTLYRLAADKENFKQWELVSERADGTFAFGDSSPWPWEYDYEISGQADNTSAVITFHMVTSVPEKYILQEEVAVTELDGLYYVDYVSTWDNDSIETAQGYGEAYGEGGIYEEQIKLYDASFYRSILMHLLTDDNPSFYVRFTDPVSAARELLHLDEGTGEVTEWDLEPIASLRSGETDAPDWAAALSMAGEGSRAAVTYTFAKDGSSVEILMELKEGSQGIWGPVGGGVREVYECLQDPDMLEVSPSGVEHVYVIEWSSYGIYRLGAASGLTCLWPADVAPDAVTCFYEGKLYFEGNHTGNSETGDETPEEWAGVICILDPVTGELDQESLRIPMEKKNAFPLKQIVIHSGFVHLYGNGDFWGLPLVNTREVLWNNKTYRQMSEEEKQAYGAENREYVLSHPDTLMQVSVRELEQTSALIDLDGDGVSEQVILSPDLDAEGWIWGHDWNYDAYRLQVGESVITGFASCLNNDIWAYSPDGRQIILALYEDGASGDPYTYLFAYEKGELKDLGGFHQDIRECTMENGIISGKDRFTGSVLQTDEIYASWQIGASGQVELVPQNTYDFAALNDIELLVELPVQNLPVDSSAVTGVNFGISYYTISPQTVRFIKTDSTLSWIYVEAADGSGGWFRTEGQMIKALEMEAREVFAGLSFAG